MMEKFTMLNFNPLLKNVILTRKPITNMKFDGGSVQKPTALSYAGFKTALNFVLYCHYSTVVHLWTKFMFH